MASGEEVCFGTHEPRVEMYVEMDMDMDVDMDVDVDMGCVCR